MKTELRQRPHNLVPGAQVFEIWYGGALIGQVTGADGPGVRIISKYSHGARHHAQSACHAGPRDRHTYWRLISASARLPLPVTITSRLYLLVLTPLRRSL